MNRSKSVLFSAVVSVALSLSAAAFADVDAAKKYIAEAGEQITSNDLESATSKLELAEAELDGVDAGPKAELSAQIKALRTKIAGAAAAADLPKYKRELENLMTDAEGNIGNLVTWGGTESELTELFNDEKAKAALGDQLTAAQKKFATFKKLHMKKAGAVYAEQSEAAVADAERQWQESKAIFADKDASPNSKDSAIDDVNRKVESARAQLKQMPDDDPKAKAMTARLEKLSEEFTNMALADKATEYAKRLHENLFELYKNEFDGWDKETKGTTWEEFRTHSGGDVESFNAPLTKAFISRMKSGLDGLDENNDYKPVAKAKPVVAVVDEATKAYEGAYKKMLSFVTPVVNDGLKATVDDTTSNGLSRLKDAVRLSLGEQSPEGLAMQEKIEKKLSGAQTAAAGADDAKKKLATEMQAKAADSWAHLSEGFSPEEGVDVTDAASKGKTIKFTSDNLMGYRFKPGDFYFATTLSGNPVAAKIDPKLMAGIKATEAAIGRGLGDDDSDGKWEVIAVVTGSHGKLMAKRQVESTGTVNGEQVKVTGEYAEPVDAVIIEIVAARCGPFAGAKGTGVLKPDGTVGQ